MKNIKKDYISACRRQEGFTLVELLVVVAIIGILASVVLASLNKARNKGKDAVIKVSIASIRSEAGVFFSDNGTYGGVCNYPKIIMMLEKATSLSPGVATCSENGIAWAASAVMMDTSKFWCADITGFSGEQAYSHTDAAGISAYLCD